MVTKIGGGRGVPSRRQTLWLAPIFERLVVRTPRRPGRRATLTPGTRPPFAPACWQHFDDPEDTRIVVLDETVTGVVVDAAGTARDS